MQNIFECLRSCSFAHSTGSHSIHLSSARGDQLDTGKSIVSRPSFAAFICAFLLKSTHLIHTRYSRVASADGTARTAPDWMISIKSRAENRMSARHDRLWCASGACSTWNTCMFNTPQVIGKYTNRTDIEHTVQQFGQASQTQRDNREIVLYNFATVCRECGDSGSGIARSNTRTFTSLHMRCDCRWQNGTKFS